jgi:hypothetical protein
MANRWMAIASFGAGITVAGALAVAVPSAMWSTVSWVAAGLLFMSIVLPALLPSPMPRGNSTSDATNIWLIGPLSTLHGALVIVAVIALWLGLTGRPAFSWVADVVWCGTLVVGYSLLNASTGVVSWAAAQTTPAAADPKSRWNVLLRTLATRVENDTLRRSLNQLVERVQFAANEPAFSQVPETDSITTLLLKLEPALGNPDQCVELLRSVEILLQQREQTIRAARSRA